MEGSKPVFSFACAFHPAAQCIHHILHTVANAEYGYAKVEDLIIGFGAILFVDAGGASGQNDSLRLKCADFVRCYIRRLNLTVHPAFSNPTRDQLVELGAEIDDEYHIPFVSV